MQQKVVLVLIDGMRPDGFLKCGHPFAQKLMQISKYTLNAKTVVPSVTLPCHMSLFHSVDPDRHGIVSNYYTPQVRPIEGLYEMLALSGKKSAMFYTWEPLRDLSRPGRLHTAEMLNIARQENVDVKITDRAIEYVNKELPDFTFLYLGETDEFGGHKYGWMSDEYLKYINVAIGCVEKVYNSLPKDYTLILLADHGGHDRTHGTDKEEDVTIPLFAIGEGFEQGTTFDSEVSIKDVAVTVAKIVGCNCAPEWEGNSLL